MWVPARCCAGWDSAGSVTGSTRLSWIGPLHASHPELRHRLLHILGPHELQRLIDAAPPTLARRLAELRASPVPARRQLRTSGWRIRRPPEAPPPADLSDQK